VAKVSMSHGLNAHLVHKWRRQAQSGVEPVSAFVPITLAAPPVASEAAQFVDLELQRGAVSVRVRVRVRWPMAGASSCAAWLREILR
jgi:transposase